MTQPKIRMVQRPIGKTNQLCSCALFSKTWFYQPFAGHMDEARMVGRNLQQNDGGMGFEGSFRYHGWRYRY